MSSSVVVPVLGTICGTPTDVGKALVAVATAAKADIESIIGNASAAGNASYKYRVVATSLQACTLTSGVLTENSNGALAAQDGATIAVGDVLFLPPTLTNVPAAANAGPWVVTALGAAGSKWTMARPAWWAAGATAQEGQIVEGSGEGTKWAGDAWKVFAVSGKIVDTDDLTWYPRWDTATTSAASSGVTPAVTTLFVSPTAFIAAQIASAGGTAVKSPTATSVTPGAPGTSSFTITVTSGDTSTFKVRVQNW